jgi:hypothetical protein
MQTMCFVLVHVCSTGLYTVRSILIAALFHILRIDTPDFLVKIRRWIRCLVHETRAMQVGLRG